MVIGLVDLGLSITTVSGERVSYKTAHATTDTMANKINTAKNTYCQSDVVVDDSASSEQVIGSLIIIALCPFSSNV